MENKKFDNHLIIGVFLVFLTLKLAGIGTVAQWSWWWVTAPIWGSFIFGIVASVLEKREDD
jgi:hypothetical protein